MPSAKKQTQTMESCISHARLVWAADSPQYRQRLSAVQNMLVESAYPVTIVDQPVFRSMITTLDPKFKIPHKYYDIIGTGPQPHVFF